MVVAFSALAALLMGFTVFVMLPGVQLNRLHPAEAQIRYTYEQTLGRSIYIREGCVYCHTQQVRAPFYGSDVERGWGSRGSLPNDYIYDNPVLLGTQRIGPDLHDAGNRLGERNEILAHLYQPRAIEPASIMPAYDYLFEVKPAALVLPSETLVSVDASVAPDSGHVIVASEQALALSEYLMGLKLGEM